MCKKVIALLLVLCMLSMMLTVMTVSATTSTPVTETFDGTGSVSEASTGWYYKSAAADGSLLVKPAFSSYGKHQTVVEDGYSGKGLKIHNDTTTNNAGNYRGSAIQTMDMTLTGTNSFVLSYKLKFTTLPDYTGTTNPWLHLSALTAGSTPAKANSGLYLLKGSSINDTSISVGAWYTVITRLSGTGTAKTLETYILDENNTVWNTNAVSVTGLSADTLAFEPVYMEGGRLVKGNPAVLVVDDVSLTEYDSSTQKISLDTANTSIADNATDIAIGANFNIAFDQALAETDAAAVKLYKAGDSDNPVDFTVENAVFNRFTLNPDTDLDGNTDYVLDFSGVMGAGNLGIDGTTAIAFKTVNPDAAAPLVLDEANTNVPLADVPLSGASFTVKFDQTITAPVEGDTVKLYAEDDAEKTSLDINIALTADGKGFTVTAVNDFGINKSYILDFAGVTSALGGALEEGATTSYTFTTVVYRDMLYAEDTLETATEGIKGTSYTTSVVLAKSDADVTLSSEYGYAGSMGMQVYEDNSYSLLNSNEFELDASETLYFEYKMNIADYAVDEAGNRSARIAAGGTSDSKTIMYIGESSAGIPTISNRSNTQQYAYTKGVWYTVICEVDTDGTCIGYLFDENGEKVFEASSSVSITAGPVIFYYITAGSGYNGHDIRFDDFKVYRVSNIESAHPLTLDEGKSSVYDGQTQVSPSTYLTLGFSQPLASDLDPASAVSLYVGNTQISASVVRPSGNEIRIIPAVTINEETTYTIKLSGITSLSGSTADIPNEISFTTKDAIYPVKVTGTDLVIADDGNVASGTVTLNMRNAREEVGGVMMVVAYTDNNLSEFIDMEIISGITVESGESNVELTLDKNYSGVGYVEFMFYDSVDNLSALMHNYRVTK